MTTPWRSTELLRFADRRHAGAVLAHQLQHFADRPDLVVLALPRGGVPVAFEVARALGAPMDVFVVRKLGMPGHPELAMGAIASGGVRVMNEDVFAWYRPSAAAIEAVIRTEHAELERRERAYRDGRAACTDRRAHRHSGRRRSGHGIHDASGGARDSPAWARPCCRGRAGRRSRDVRGAARDGRRGRVRADAGAIFRSRPLVHRLFSDDDDEVRQLLSSQGAAATRKRSA